MENKLSTRTQHNAQYNKYTHSFNVEISCCLRFADEQLRHSLMMLWKANAGAPKEIESLNYLRFPPVFYLRLFKTKPKFNLR